MLHTTLEILRKKHACTSGFRKLKESLPSGHADDSPITLAHILESNGIRDAIWALRATIEPTGKAAAFELACRAAERALAHFEKRYPEDKRPRDAIEAARAYQRGEITREQLAAKRSDAYAAADAADADADAAYADAAYAAYAAAYAADAAYAYADADADAAADAAASAYATSAYAYATAYAASVGARKAEREAQAADYRELLARFCAPCAHS
jgi:hypothetical protein